MEKLRKSNLRYRTQQQQEEQQAITPLTNKTGLTPSLNDELKQIPFEYSVTAVSALV
jgi:hypothetical protein